MPSAHTQIPTSAIIVGGFEDDDTLAAPAEAKLITEIHITLLALHTELHEPLLRAELHEPLLMAELPVHAAVPAPSDGDVALPGCVPLDQFCALFPFHILTDSEGMLIQVSFCGGILSKHKQQAVHSMNFSVILSHRYLMTSPQFWKT